MVDILSYQDAKKIQEKYGERKIVVAGGCFDLLHIGHISLLEGAKKQGDILVILLESDAAIQKKKGINRPIHNQKQRAQLAGALRTVDIIVMLKDTMLDEDYDNLLTVIHPSIIATTENDPSISHKKRQAEKVGAQVITVNKYIPEVSTTKLLTILSKEL